MGKVARAVWSCVLAVGLSAVEALAAQGTLHVIHTSDVRGTVGICG